MTWISSDVLVSPPEGTILVQSSHNTWAHATCCIWSNLTEEGDIALRAVDKDGELIAQQYIPIGTGRNYANLTMPYPGSGAFRLQLVAITNIIGSIQCSIDP